MLSRRATAYLPGPEVPEGQVPDPLVAAGAVLLQADLLERGYLVSPQLLDRLQRLRAESLGVHGEALLADVDAALGVDRPHVPLFRGFPDSVPPDTVGLWVNRVLSWLAQWPEQPCVLCGRQGTVVAVSPCAHLVCRACFDGGDYSACPICRQRVDVDDPFLRPVAAPRKRRVWRREESVVLPQRARVLGCGQDARADALAEARALLGRPASLPPQDADDLVALLDALGRADLSWLPELIPARSTKALVLAWLAADPTCWAEMADRLGTATDVLRLLVALSGGDPGLLEVARFGAVSRPLRRLLLSVLDRLKPELLVEDLHRHRALWIHAAERLHPFEYATRFPRAAAAFAVLRRTPVNQGTSTGREDDRQDVSALSPAVLMAAEEAGYRVSGGRLRTGFLFGQVEAALAVGDVGTATRLLARRPGSLLRRLDHLLRSASGDPVAVEGVLSQAESVVRQASAAVVVSTLAALRARDRPQEVRVFFPKGGTARVHLVDDRRAPLPAGVVRRVEGLLTGELLRRADQLGPVEVAWVDRSLDTVTAPFTERTASRALVTIPRGSRVDIPAGRQLRLFLHWLEGEQRVDLDLSVAFFDAGWRHVATCDYTNMRVAEQGAVHSGDLTSAPPPLGASEFLDLDTELLLRHRIRYAVAVVFSYNNVAFEDIPEAFAGIMLRADEPAVGPVFDPRAVEQRFDLTGRARAVVPLLVDLQARTLRWLDVVQGVSGTGHAVHRHVDALAAVGQNLDHYYASGARVSLGEAAGWHAAARARTVLLRDPDGTIARLDRLPAESSLSFLRRITSRDRAVVPTDAAQPELAFLLHGDIDIPDGSTAFALHPRNLDPTRSRILTAAEVVGSLTPAD